MAKLTLTEYQVKEALNKWAPSQWLDIPVAQIDKIAALMADRKRYGQPAQDTLRKHLGLTISEASACVSAINLER